MLGVVVCGGHVAQLGDDKAQWKLHARNWAQTTIDKLSKLNLPFVLSVTQSQYAGYAEIFDKKILVPDNGIFDFTGPLCAVLSVHLAYDTKDLFVLACDLPLMEVSLLKELVNAYSKEPDADAFIYTNEEEPEPLCGIYRASALIHVFDLHEKHLLEKHSMKYMLEHIRVHSIPISRDQQQAFRNFSAHAELNGM